MGKQDATDYKLKLLCNVLSWRSSKYL